MADASLLVVLDEARKKTLRVVDGITRKHALWTPPGERNHILWNTGHIYCMVERVTTAALTGITEVPESLPENWWTMFGWNSQPDQIDREAWPNPSEIVEQLYEQHHRLRHYLASIPEHELASAPDGKQASSESKTTRGLILHALHDESFHAGQIWLLRKLLVHHRQATR